MIKLIVKFCVSNKLAGVQITAELLNKILCGVCEEAYFVDC